MFSPWLPWLLPVLTAAGGRFNAHLVYRSCRDDIYRAGKTDWPEDARLLYPFFVSISWAPGIFAKVLTVPLVVYALMEGNELIWPVLLGWLTAWYSCSLPLRSAAQKLRVPDCRNRFREVAIGMIEYLGYLLILGTMLSMQEPVWSLRTASVLGGGLLAFAGWNSLVQTWSRIFVKKRPAVPERLRLIVTSAAEELNVPLPVIFMIDSERAEAAAYPANQSMGFTRTIVELLNDAELAAVARHEIMHLAEPVPVIALRHLGILAYLPLFVFRPLAASWDPFWAMAVVLLWMQLVWLVFRDLSQSMERRADKGGGESDPAAMASALEKVYRHSRSPAVLKTTGSHPDLWSRLSALGVTPVWQKPGEPSMESIVGLRQVCWMVALITLAGSALLLYAAN